MKHFTWLLIAVGLLTAAGRAATDPGQLIARDDFDRDLANWVVEQTPHGTTQIRDGRLEINDGAGPGSNGGCTVWFRQKFTGPIQIEYEATLLDQGGPNDRVSDLNCFWMAADPKSPDDLFAGSKERGGRFEQYDALRLYYVGYGANGNKTTRFRRYPGDGTRPLDPGTGERLESKYMNIPNRTVHIKLIADGGRVQFWRDDELIFDFTDPQPFREGWFGVRTVRNHLTIDNFRVWRLPTHP